MLQGRVYNVYTSLARYKNGLFYTELDKNRCWELRRTAVKEWLSNQDKYIVSYDLLIDIDGDTHDDFDYVLETAQRITQLFDKCKCPFQLKFSGKGFHIIVPGSYLPIMSFNSDDDNNIYTFCCSIAKKLENNYSCLVDTTIYDSRRLVKLAYTIAHYKTGSFLCAPVSIEGLKNFKIDNYNMDLNNFNPVNPLPRLVINNPNGTIHKLIDELKLKVVIENDNKT